MSDSDGTALYFDQVDWVAGDDIVIAASGKSAWEGEKRRVVTVSSDKKTLTLNESLSFSHAGVYDRSDLHVYLGWSRCQ